MKTPSKVILFIALLVLFSNCEKNKFSTTPEITLTSFLTNGASAVIKVRFTDGDGDIGKDRNDTVPYYDFFSIYFEKRNGKFVQAPIAFQNNYRIPLLNNTGKAKALQGEIVIEDFPSLNPFSRFDTVKFEFYIFDNAGNESNHVTTNEIIRGQSKEWQ